MAAEDDRLPQEKIAAALRAEILAGDYVPDDELPTTKDLIERYGGTNPTITRAMRILKREGMVVGRRGSRTRVRQRRVFTVDAQAYFPPTPDGYSYDILAACEAKLPADCADGLGLPAGENALLRKRLTKYAGDPVELCSSYYPLDLARGTKLMSSKKILGGAPRVLADLGFPQRRMVDRVTARPPTEEEVIALDVPTGLPVVRTFRVIYSDEDRPVEASVMVKPAHIYELRYEEQIH